MKPPVQSLILDEVNKLCFCVWGGGIWGTLLLVQFLPVTPSTLVKIETVSALRVCMCVFLPHSAVGILSGS